MNTPLHPNPPHPTLSPYPIPYPTPLRRIDDFLETGPCRHCLCPSRNIRNPVSPHRHSWSRNKSLACTAWQIEVPKLYWKVRPNVRFGHFYLVVLFFPIEASFLSIGLMVWSFFYSLIRHSKGQNKLNNIYYTCPSKNCLRVHIYHINENNSLSFCNIVHFVLH